MKTTNEILKETGLSYPVFTHLRDLGIVPKPRLKGQGRRRGVVGVYEDDVIEIINWVKNRREKGCTLSQIAEQRRDELAGINVFKPTEEYLIPIKAGEVKSYIEAYSGFYSWVQKQIGQHMPGYEFHSVQLEVTMKEGEEFLRVKEIKVKPKAGNRLEEEV